MTKSELRAMGDILNATDEHLLLSIKDCHIKGLHSIVFGMSNHWDAQLRRIYLSEPNALPKGKLGIHDHKYPLTMQLVDGAVVNTTSIIGEAEGSEEYYHHLFKGSASKESSWVSVGTTRAYESVSTRLMRDPLSLKANELHTVHVLGGKKASWRIREDDVSRAGTTQLLTSESSVTLPSYTRWETASDVRAFCWDFFNNKHT